MDTDRIVTIDWNTDLADQLDWHWHAQLRPRLDGLTDAEYFWEPVRDCWSIRRRGESSASHAVGAGDYVMDYAIPEPDPAPVTTVAWRLAHMIVGLFASRTATHFGGPPADWPTWEYATTAKEALRQLDDAYAAWLAGVHELGETGLARPVGPAEGDGQYADSPMADLILHINREAIHHGAELALLRDLYRWKGEGNAR
jgi:DinB superfamily